MNSSGCVQYRGSVNISGSKKILTCLGTETFPVSREHLDRPDKPRNLGPKEQLSTNSSMEQRF